MKFNRTTRLLVPFLVVLIGLGSLPIFSSSARAQNKIDYARRLADYGYFELAIHQLNRMENQSDVPERIRSYVPVVRSYITMREAEQRDDLMARVEGIEKAINELKSFVNENDDHPKLADARSTLAETLRKVGKIWIKIAKRNPDMKKKARSSGTSHLNAASSQYGKIAEQQKQGFEKCSNKLNKIITKHELSRLYRATGAKNKQFKLLRNVLGSIGDYLWSSCASRHDTLKIRARTYASMSHLELSQIFEERGKKQKARSHESNAQQYFQSVTNLVDVLRDRKEISRTTFTVVNNLVLRAHKFWIDYLYDLEKYDEAFNKIENLQAKYANWPHPLRGGQKSVNPASFEPGRSLLLLKAKILFDRGGRQRALDLVKRLANYSGKTGEEAQELAQKWSEKLGPGSLSVEDVLDRTDDLIGNKEYQKALDFIKKGFDKITTREQAIRWKWRFLDRKALVYAEMKRWYEAAVLYEHIHDRFHRILSMPLQRANKEDRTEVERILKNESNDFRTFRNLVLRANYQAAASYGRVREKTGFQKDEKKYQELLDHLSDEHPDSEWAQKTTLLAGDLLREQGKYDQALKRFKQPEKGTKIWEMAQVKLGYTYYQKGRSLAENNKTEEARTAFLNAAETLKSFLDYLRQIPDRTKDQKNRAWSALDVTAYSYLHSTVEKSDKVLELFSKETLSEFELSPEKVARAHRHRLNALRQKGELDRAAEVANRMYEEFRDAPATLKALGDLAEHFEKLRENTDDQEKRKKYRENEVTFYYRWITQKLKKNGEANASNVFNVAGKLREYGVSADRKRALQRSEKLLNTLLNGTFEGRNVRLIASDSKAPEDEVKEELALVYTELGKLDRARKLYDQLLEGQGSLTESILTGNAKLLISRMKQAKQKGDSEQLKQVYNESKKFISKRILNPTDEGQEIWWKGWKAYIEVLLIEGSEQQQARHIFKRLRQKKKNGNPFQGHEELFKELLDRYPTKLNL